MAVQVSEQLRQLVTASVIGGAMGLWFDILQPFRQSTDKRLAFLWDILFLVVSGAAIFLYGRRSGAGMRLFFLCAVGGGFCFYLWSLHGLTAGVLLRAKHFLQIKLEKIKKRAVSLRKSCEKEGKT